MPVRKALLPTPVGPLLAVRDAEGLRGLWFDRPLDAAEGRHDEEAFGDVRGQLQEYFAATRRDFDLPLAPQGTPFQLGVWRQLLRIPYGTTTSYGALAATMGSPGAARAVGLANGRNPIPIVIPCHRVVGADGSLTGYGGGMDRKRTLLELEGIPCGAQGTLFR